MLFSLSAWGEPSPDQVFASFRAQQGLSVPVWSQPLAQASQFRASVLAGEGRLSHQDADGRGPAEQLAAQGFPPGLYGEILGAGTDFSSVWAAWLASPPHRAVLLDARWTFWGWGVQPLGTSNVWVVRFSAP